MATVQQTHKSDYILYDDAVLANGDAIDFTAPPASGDERYDKLAGRGAVHVFDHNGTTLVLRHYQRGGMIAQVIHDTYCWMGIKRTRAWREWYLLKEMWAQGLPVPRPVAAHVSRAGLGYRADIVTRLVPGARTLAEALTRERLPARDWRAIGAMLKRFHTHGIRHADLNAHNILVDETGRWYLIDFDRGGRRTPARRWQLANLERLHRSLDKLAGQRAGFHFGDAEWARLLHGYEAA